VSERKQSSEACACVRKPRGGGATAGEPARAGKTAAGTGSNKARAATHDDRERKGLVLEDGGQGALGWPKHPRGSVNPYTPQRHSCCDECVERLIPELRNREVEMDGAGRSKDRNHRPACSRKGPGATRNGRRRTSKCRWIGWYEDPVLEWRRPGGTDSAEMSQG
jgi:hypothetical protein